MAADTAQSPHSYNGSVIVSARKFENAWKAIECAGKRLPEEKHFRDLLEILSLHALSERLYWDGTIPGKWRGVTYRSVTKLGIQNRVRELSPDPDNTSRAANRAVELCTPTLEMGFDHLPVGEHPVRPDAHKPFFDTLSRLSRASASDRHSIALESMSAQSDGAKLIIGLSFESHDPLLAEINRRHAALRSAKERSALMWLLTESFRPFLLNEWGAEEGSMVHVNTHGAHAIRRYGAWLWLDLERELCKTGPGAPRIPPWNSDDASYHVPMVGLEVLRRGKHKKVKHPLDLFEIADGLADEIRGFRQLQEWLIDVRCRVDRGEDLRTIATEMRRHLSEHGWERSLHSVRPLRRRIPYYVLPATVSAAPLAAILQSLGVTDWEGTSLTYLVSVAVAVGLRARNDAAKTRTAGYINAVEHLMPSESQLQSEDVMSLVRTIWHVR